MSKKNIAAIVFLLALSAVCMSLGKWQLSRAAERVALTEEITAGRNQPLIDLSSAPGNTHNWQPSRATGYWRPDLTVLLENRNYQGRPGYWVATPLILDSDDNEAVLVLRGWLARTTSQPVLPPLQAEEAVSIQGELRSHVPRMYELMRLWGPEAESLPSTLPSAGGRIPTVQNLQIADLERVSNLRLRPYVLLQQQVSPLAKTLA
ncbi:SURF1 family protein [Paenalcaligenes niemegkensis]|uniref:SURF1 family protein n=1 Tax=Paenalcaligenes niemegkensis TaxID=2895469 RepID=UPI001EE92D12|nr:SURF1 family protein [Paenalcaligenes niemegkensis]MCQ9617723.1 SURF1 family protein [Paenalcaligenes niemegkensis]